MAIGRERVAVRLVRRRRRPVPRAAAVLRTVDALDAAAWGDPDRDVLPVAFVIAGRRRVELQALRADVRDRRRQAEEAGSVEAVEEPVLDVVAAAEGPVGGRADVGVAHRVREVTKSNLRVDPLIGEKAARAERRPRQVRRAQRSMLRAVGVHVPRLADVPVEGRRHVELVGVEVDQGCDGGHERLEPGQARGRLRLRHVADRTGRRRHERVEAAVRVAADRRLAGEPPAGLRAQRHPRVPARHVDGRLREMPQRQVGPDREDLQPPVAVVRQRHPIHGDSCRVGDARPLRPHDRARRRLTRGLLVAVEEIAAGAAHDGREPAALLPRHRDAVQAVRGVERGGPLPRGPAAVRCGLEDVGDAVVGEGRGDLDPAVIVRADGERLDREAGRGAGERLPARPPARRLRAHAQRAAALGEEQEEAVALPCHGDRGDVHYARDVHPRAPALTGRDLRVVPDDAERIRGDDGQAAVGVHARGNVRQRRVVVRIAERVTTPTTGRRARSASCGRACPIRPGRTPPGGRRRSHVRSPA